MEKILYNYFGYNEEHIKNKSAYLIQKTYRNYKRYKKNKICDYIKYFDLFNSKTDLELEKEDEEEINYWKNQRYLIKNKVLGNYEII